MRNNRTGIPGMQFRWVTFRTPTVYPYIIATARGRNRSISVDRNGLELSVRLAAEHRALHGMPSTDETKLLDALRAFLKTRPKEKK